MPTSSKWLTISALTRRLFRFPLFDFIDIVIRNETGAMWAKESLIETLNDLVSLGSTLEQLATLIQGHLYPMWDELKTLFFLSFRV